MDKKQDLEFSVSAKQAECLEYFSDDKTSEIGYGGAAGGGKSWVGVQAIWTAAVKYPGTRWFFGRKELSNLRKTTLNTYYKFLDHYKIPKQYRGKLNNKDNVIYFPNTSEIMLLDCAYQPSDPLYTRFGSLELTGGFIDESNEIQEQCITILSTRIGRQKNREFDIKPVMLETFNPDKGHVYRRFYKPRRDSMLPDYRKFIPALVTDNKYIDPNYIEQLRKADEITRQRLLYGNFEYDNTFGKLFRYDEIYDLFRNNIDKNENYYISCDVARLGNDRTVIGVRRGLELIKFLTFREYTTDQTADKLKELEEEYKVNRNHIVVDSDGVGGGVADMLRGCVNFVNNSSAFKTYAEQNNPYVVRNFQNLKTQCYFKLKELMERRLIKVNAEGNVKDDLSNELDNVLLKNADKDQKISLESKDDMKKRIGRSPDYADCVMMRMYRLVREEENLSGNRGFEGVVEANYDELLF